MPQWLYNTIDWLSLPKTAGSVGAFGLVLTIVGFVVTIIQVRRSKSAAQAATDATRALQRQINRFDAIAECSSAVQALQEIERLHRKGPLDELPERYHVVRAKLNQLRSISPQPGPEHLTNIQNAVSQLATLKEKAEKLISDGQLSVNVARSNRVTSKIIDDLFMLLATLRRDTE